MRNLIVKLGSVPGSGKRKGKMLPDCDMDGSQRLIQVTNHVEKVTELADERESVQGERIQWLTLRV